MANTNTAMILVAFLLVISMELISASSPSSTSHRLSKRWGSNCVARCADPRNKSWQNPCGSCDHSQCKYEGCIHYGAFFTYWKPDPCTQCYCQGGWKNCFRTDCNKNLDCFGYPKMRRPGKCCEECDFGASNDACSLIPVSYEAYRGSGAGRTCSKVVKHDCNKLFINAGGNMYRCSARTGFSKVKDSPGCSGEEGWYMDNTQCQQEKITNFRFMPVDYDPNPTCYPLPPE